MPRRKTQTPLQIERISAILFDVDGTLSDSDDRMVETAHGMLRFLHPLLGDEHSRRLARWLVRNAESPANLLLEWADRLGVDHFFARFLDRRAQIDAPAANPTDFPVIPGVPEMLAELSIKFPLAIVSARNNLTTRLFLSLNHLDGYFPVVVTSQTCTRTKPFPDPIRFAAEELGVHVNECLMVGDTVTDVRAALAAGAQSLSVLCGFGTKAELEQAGTQQILESTANLMAFLENQPG